MKSILTVSLLSALLASAAPLPEKADLLASNTVLALYEGTHFHPCRHMTALCPDRCDHASSLAHFRVLRNVRYQKIGQYGDDKMNEGDTAMVDVRRDIPGQDAQVAQFISQLKPGDAVLITINHYYIQQEHNFFPVRPVVSIKIAQK